MPREVAGAAAESSGCEQPPSRSTRQGPRRRLLLSALCRLFSALAGHRQLSLAERGSPPAKEAAASCSPCVTLLPLPLAPALGVTRKLRSRRQAPCVGPKPRGPKQVQRAGRLVTWAPRSLQPPLQSSGSQTGRPHRLRGSGLRAHVRPEVLRPPQAVLTPLISAHFARNSFASRLAPSARLYQAPTMCRGQHHRQEAGSSAALLL